MKHQKKQKKLFGSGHLRTARGRCCNYIRRSSSCKVLNFIGQSKAAAKVAPEVQARSKANAAALAEKFGIRTAMKLKLVPRAEEENLKEKPSMIEKSKMPGSDRGNVSAGGRNGESVWNNPRTSGLIAAALLLVMLVTAVWSANANDSAGNEPTELASTQTGSLQLAKEYIYAGSRMLAIEDYGLNSSTPTPTPTATSTPTPPTVFAVSGQVTLNTSQAVSGATITAKQNGAVVGSAVTDSSGNYILNNLPAGGAFTISSVSPLAFSAPDQTVSNLTANQTINFNAIKSNLIISEFRLHGTTSADDYVELYNQTNNPLDISGVVLASSDDLNAPKLTIPGAPGSGTTTIPGRGHYLIAGSDYSLTSYATPDASLSADIPDGAGIGIFLTSSNFSTASRLDAVGFGGTNSIFAEGTSLNPAGGITVNGQTAFVRLMVTDAYPNDSNNNTADFAFVAPDQAIYSSVQSVLGAPGPENQQSSIFKNGNLTAALLDNGTSGSSQPNQISSPSDTDIAPLGTRTIGRTYTNTSNKTLTGIRIRIIAITTDHTPQTYNPQAIIRALNAADITVTKADGSTVPVKGATLEAPSNPAVGGGLNSSLTVNLTTPLNPGESFNIFTKIGFWGSGRLVFNTALEAKHVP